ncbi:MAG: DUF4263 domain-containing protein [Chloroflexi bacterium]|nr:DUF4263 domain-containing protein [Chloroflexota bacterium]
MSRLSITYETVPGPARMSNDEYVAMCNQRYKELLERNTEECEVQNFLESYPSLVPGHSTPGARSGHMPLHCSLITQPKLHGLDDYIPDFMWVSTHSGAWFPTLIEIEKPGKKIFKQDGTPSAEFNHARNQLNQWRSWFKDPTNQLQFIRSYGIPDYMLARTMQPHMILIYGRRSEFENDDRLTQQRGTLLSGADEELMSFDALQVDEFLTQAFTVKGTGRGRYRAVTVPPVFSTGPNRAERLLYIDGVSDAIDNNPHISEDRKTFLKTRITYWKGWASASKSRVISHRDDE